MSSENWSLSDAKLLWLVILLLLLGLAAKSDTLRNFIIAAYKVVKKRSFAVGLAFASRFCRALPLDTDGSGRREASAGFLFVFIALNILAGLGLVVISIARPNALWASSATIIGFSFLLMANVLVIIAALAVLNEDYKMINGISNRTPSELQSERSITSKELLITSSIIICFCISALLWSIDFAKPGTILARQIGTNAAPLAYVAATLKSLPGGAGLLWLAGLSSEVQFATNYASIASNLIYLTGSALLIGTIAFLFQQHSEVRSLSAALISSTGTAYDYLIQRARRAPGFFREYLVSEIIGNSHALTFQHAMRIVFDLDVWTAKVSLLHHLRQWHGGVSIDQIKELDKHLRASPSVSTRIARNIMAKASEQITFENDRDKRIALAMIIFWAMRNILPEPTRDHYRKSAKQYVHKAVGRISPDLYAIIRDLPNDVERLIAIAIIEDLPLENFPRFFLRYILNYPLNVQKAGLEACISICRKPNISFTLYDYSRIIDTIGYHMKNNHLKFEPEVIAKLVALQDVCYRRKNTLSQIRAKN